jgi:hypothetical protein
VDWAQFLQARLDELQALAEAADPGPWEFEGDDPTDDELYTAGEDDESFGYPVAYTRGRQVGNGQFMAAVNPARVLRMVKAMRDILARYERGLSGDLPEWKAGRELVEAGLAVLLGAIRDLAAAWEDHPDYPGRNV